MFFLVLGLSLKKKKKDQRAISRGVKHQGGHWRNFSFSSVDTEKCQLLFPLLTEII
jgi:hypothetical protein